MALLVCSSTPSARAAPQWNTGLVASGCLLGRADDWFETVAFCGALRGDVLFARERTRDFGLGPYVLVGTAAFDDARGAVGLTALLPIAEDFPLVTSGGVLRTSEGAMGVDASVFFGLRSYNYYGGYNFAAGGSLGLQRTFGEQASTAVSVGVQVDGLLLALPFVLLWGAVQ